MGRMAQGGVHRVDDDAGRLLQVVQDVELGPALGNLCLYRASAPHMRGLGTDEPRGKQRSMERRTVSADAGEELPAVQQRLRRVAGECGHCLRCSTCRPPGTSSSQFQLAMAMGPIVLISELTVGRSRAEASANNKLGIGSVFRRI